MFNKSEGDINNLAIQMIEQDLIKALELFQYNVKENASFLSYVNYGVFLTEFGSDILEYIAQPYKEAEHYLLLAQKQNSCFGAAVALGELYLKEENIIWRFCVLKMHLIFVRHIVYIIIWL